VPDTSMSSILSPEVPTAPAQPSRTPLLTSTLVESTPPIMRPFGDPKAMRGLIFDNVMQAVSQKYPLENSRYQLSLKNLRYRNKSPYTLEEQKKAIMQGNSLDYQLVGDWNLIDKATGKSVDKRPTLVAHVPYATDRGTFIYKGNEYTVANQMRLKPGVFTRVKENGIIEAHFNTKPGTGPSFRLHMEPDTGIFRLNVGQSNLKLYPILKAMGVSDKELEAAWGGDLLRTNIQAEDPRAVGRAYAALVSSRSDQAVGGSDNEQVEKVAYDVHITFDESEQLLADGAIEKVGEEETRAPVVAIDLDGTLAKPYESFDPDFIPEPRRGARAALESFKSKGYKVIIWTCRGKDDVTKAWLEKHKIPYDHINKNPDQLEDMSEKVTADLYIDDKALDADGPWNEIRERAEKLLEKSAKIGARESDLRWSKLWFKGNIRAETGKNGEPWVKVDVHRGLLDAAFDSLKGEGFNVEKAPNEPHITLIRSEELAPLIEKHKNKWQGACKNGMPVKFALKRIVHLVPSGWKDVNRVWFIEVESPDLLKYRTELGLPELPKAKNGNDHRFHITFAVSKNKGEVKRAYELLTEKRAAGQTGELTLSRPTNITDEGEGLNTTFARMGLDPDVTLATLGESHANVGTPVILRATKKLLNIQKGTEEVDDRDSLAFQTVHSPEDFFAERIRKDAGQVGRKLLWRSTLRGNLKHMPSGALTPQLQGVLLRSGMGMPLEEINPMDVFDQHLRVLRLGEGGIPSLDSVPDECYDACTEVFTSSGWLPWASVDESTEFACLLNGHLSFQRAVRLIEKPYEGEMYRIKTRCLDLLVTPNHRLWVQKYRGSSVERCGEAPWGFELARESHRHPRQFLISHKPYTGLPTDVFVLPEVDGARKTYDKLLLENWAEFIGWYVSEGSIDSFALRERSKYHITISQSASANSENVERINRLLTDLDFSHSYTGHNFVIVNKQLGNYLEGLGRLAHEKRLPDCVFDWPLTARERLFSALISGDGSEKENGCRVYHSTSLLLVTQVIRLAITLGYAAKERMPYKRENEAHRTCFSCGILTSSVQGVTSERQYDSCYSIEHYIGKVYCAEVPGELLLVRRNGSVPVWSGNSRNVQPSHFGYIDPIRAPESSKIGVDSRLSHGAFKGSDGKVYTDMLDVRTGKRTSIPAENTAKAVIAFPGEMAKKGKQVRAMVNSRQVEYVDKGEVDYELLSHNRMFSATSNLVPLISGIKGGRLLMGAKFVAQALPLREAEAPLVQNLSDIQGRSFDDLYGERVGAIRAVEPGVVESVNKTGIKVRYKSGETEVHQLYNNFPFNRKTYIHNVPAVKVGDRVRPGDVLASSNFTDSKGTLAIGTNLRTAYMPYKGLNYEDAIVISEGAAKRLASEHMYQHKLDVEGADMEVGRKQYISIYPAKYSREQLGSIDDQGVVKVGTKVKYGDPLVLSLNRTKTRGVHRGHKPLFSDASLTWGHESEGVVTDVDQTKEGGWNVTVKAYSPAQEGDKLAGRYGDKGVISKIVPDDQMPHGADNKPYEILLNPLGVISRGNPSQVFETLLGKVARKRGEAIKIPSFMDENLIDHVQKELSHAGLRDTDDLIDPETGRKIPGILTGERFIMKLHHTAESKGKGRDVGAYTSEGLPAKGGEFGAKRISNMEINSLLSHGATEVLRDAQIVRGQRNDDYWRAFRLGLTPPSPKVPMVYDKFLSYLKGAGINTKKDGSRMQLFAMTDKDVDKITSGPVKNAQTVLGDTLKPIDGGLFDQGLTGGHGGNRWSHINLTEPVPNPVMEEPIRRLLGLTQKEYEAVIAGKKDLQGKVGGAAIKHALGQIRVDSAIEYHRGIIKDGPKSKRDNSVKVLGYLQTMQKNKLDPADFVVSKVPVLPTSMRPITWHRSMPLVADSNFLYRDLIKLNEDLSKMTGVVGDKQLGNERLKVYNAFKAISGLGDPVQAKTQEKGVRGLLKHIFGSSPKVGMFQRRVLGSPVDVVGRASITPNPDLNMDQVGIPEAKAWTIYRPFIMRRLVRSGMPAVEAAKAVANQTDVAKKSMLEEIEARPVIINRAPTLHRYGFMAAWPVLTKGQTLQIPPVLTPGFNADFDGDAMNYHVPVTDAAVKDAIERMMPSRNLKAVRDFRVHYLPKNEFLLGLYLASTAKAKKEKRVFRSRGDVIAAYQRGELSVGDPVVVKEP